MDRDFFFPIALKPTFWTFSEGPFLARIQTGGPTGLHGHTGRPKEKKP